MPEQVNKNQKRTQHQKILDYFKNHKTLNRLESVYHLGIFELPSRICELKRKGYKFKIKMITALNLAGDKIKCKEYTLLD